RDPSTVCLDEAAADGQTESRALARLPAANEGLEDAAALRARDATAAVYHANRHATAAGAPGYANGEVRGRKLDRVLDQVGEHPFQLNRVGADERQLVGQREV